MKSDSYEFLSKRNGEEKGRGVTVRVSGGCGGEDLYWCTETCGTGTGTKMGYGDPSKTSSN